MIANELTPTYSTPYHWLVLMLSAMGRHDEAILTIKKAIEIEPRSAIIQTAAGLVYYYARRYDDALSSQTMFWKTTKGSCPPTKPSGWFFR